MLLIFNWINDPIVRKMSFNKNKIKLDEHEKFFYSAIKNDNILFWVYEYHSLPAGMIRVEKKNENATLNYLIDKHFRGKGHGEKMLNLAIAKLKLFWGKRNIHAYTFSSNYPSIKCLEKVGFRMVKNKDNMACLIYK